MRKLNRTRIISDSDKQLLLELKEIITGLVPDVELLLYGSAARGARLPDSDYDVLLLTSARLSEPEQRKLDEAVYDLQLTKEIVLSVIVYTREQWQSPIIQASPYRRNVMNEGILV